MHHASPVSNKHVLEEPMTCPRATFVVPGGLHPVQSVLPLATRKALTQNCRPARFRPRKSKSFRSCATDPSQQDGSDPQQHQPRPQALPVNSAPLPQGPDAGSMGFVGSKKMSISFTCSICDTRVTKSFHRQSYEKGVVVIKCPGCEKRHVIADNLGYFSRITAGRKNIEEIAQDKGQQVTRGEKDVVFDESADR